MNEPPGARARVALSGLTIAEYFRDVEGQDVLFFVDNIFRFTQAGSEVSALLGRIPSAVGYQPTWRPTWARCRNASPRPTRVRSPRCRRSTSRRRLTDPAPAASFAHLDATTNAEPRDFGTQASTRPSIRSTRPRAFSTPRVVGQSSLRHRPPRPGNPAEVQVAAGHHRDPRHGRTVGRR